MWSAAYPYGTYGIACSQFSTDFDSPAFAVITSIILVTLVILWLYLVIATIPMVISGELFLAEALEEMEKHREESKAGEKPGRGTRAFEGMDHPQRSRTRSSDAETAV